MNSIIDCMASIKALTDEINQDLKPVTDIKVLRGECPLEPGEKSTTGGGEVTFAVLVLLKSAQRLERRRMTGPEVRAMARELRQCAKILQGENNS